MPNPFTPEEERRYKEIIADCARHGAEYDRCVELLQPYRAGQRVYLGVEKMELDVLEAKAEYHYREWQLCQFRLKPFRDWQNVMAYACEEARVKGFLEGFAEEYAKGGWRADSAARRLLQKDIPVRDIAELTGLCETEIEALRA
jgi:hypothetical protein